MSKVKKAYKLYDKAIAVIDSCTTEGQMFSALRFCVLVAKRFGSIPTLTKLALWDSLESHLSTHYEIVKEKK